MMKKEKRVIPAPGIEGRDDGFHDGRNGLGGDEAGGMFQRGYGECKKLF